MFVILTIFLVMSYSRFEYGKVSASSPNVMVLARFFSTVYVRNFFGEKFRVKIWFRSEILISKSKLRN